MTARFVDEFAHLVGTSPVGPSVSVHVYADQVLESAADLAVALGPGYRVWIFLGFLEARDPWEAGPPPTPRAWFDVRDARTREAAEERARSGSS